MRCCASIRCPWTEPETEAREMITRPGPRPTRQSPCLGVGNGYGLQMSLTQAPRRLRQSF